MTSNSPGKPLTHSSSQETEQDAGGHQAFPPRNLLGSETSPYLRQHQDNPVHWRPWGEAAFAEAKATGKPVLLSIGYAACHWCHVMAHESFENPEIAAVMNRLFVNIKVDREERPEIDQIYMHALHLMGVQGGWPLTMFLDGEGRPFWGGTYFPPEPRYGRPGFPELLAEVERVYREEPEKIGKNSQTLNQALQDLQHSDPGDLIGNDLLVKASLSILRLIDPEHGGIGGAPKFPQCEAWALLWRGWWLSGNRELKQAFLRTMTAISEGGIYDHLGGGFARYSVDAEWHVPHFEKMLYDNARLIDLLLLAWQGSGKELYRQRALESCDWLLREMRVIEPESGTAKDREASFAFAGTLDADSEGVEGRFYVWTAEEIDRLLGEEAPLFRAAYDITPAGNWEGNSIPNRRRGIPFGLANEEMLAEMRTVLLQARALRIRPGRDDKILTDWNGMVITTLARASLILERPEFGQAAMTAFDFICRKMTDPERGENRLVHSRCESRNGMTALLDDYAWMAAAALSLSTLLAFSPDLQKDWPGYSPDSLLNQAKAWTEVADRWFRDEEQGGYFLAPSDGEDLLSRPKSAQDQSVPAGSAVLALVQARLWRLTGEEQYRIAAADSITSQTGSIERNFFPLATLMLADFSLESGGRLLLSGRDEDPAFQALLRAALSTPHPDLVLLRAWPGETLPVIFGGGQSAPSEDAPATAWFCVGTACRLPVTDPDDLKALLLESQAAA